MLLAGRRGSQSPQPRALGESRTECCGDATLLNATLLTRYLSPLQSIIRTIVAWRPRALLPTPDSRPGKLHDSTKCRSRKQERYCDRSCPSVHFSPTRSARSAGEEGLCFAYVFFPFFYDFCQPSYLNIYRTDLHRICRDGRTLAVDERVEVPFSILRGTLPRQPILCHLCG